MDTALAPFEIASLALTFCGLEPTVQLNREERDHVAQTEKFIQLYSMRVSIDRKYTLAEQAQAIGVSPATIKRMAKSEEFSKVAAFMSPPARSPIMAEARAYMQEELVPALLKEVMNLISSDSTRPSTKANLAINILKMAFETDQAQGSEELERRDAMAFLKDQGVQIGQVNVFINPSLAPPEYVARLQESIVEGEVVESEPLDS
jgi:hypothetical protein